jgi:hypothetical protein
MTLIAGRVSGHEADRFAGDRRADRGDDQSLEFAK